MNEFSKNKIAGERYVTVLKPETNLWIIDKKDEINWSFWDFGVLFFMIFYPFYMIYLLKKTVIFLITSSYVKTMKNKRQLQNDLDNLNKEIEKAKQELNTFSENIAGEDIDPTIVAPKNLNTVMIVKTIELTDKQKANLNVGEANLDCVR